MLNHKAANLALASLAMTVLGGCASTMSGLDGEAKFSCKVPEGVTCSSLSGVYANAVADNLPSLRAGKQGNPDAQKDVQKSGAQQIVGRAPTSGDPIRTQPKVLRIWIAPWEDADGDLHDQSYVYVMANPGRWVIEHNRKQIIDRYRPTFVQAGIAQQQKPAPQSQQQQTPGGVTLPGAQMYGPTSPQQVGGDQ